MQDMSDDNLDRLFQEAAEKHQPEYDKSKWDKMSALLDNPTSPAVSGGSSVIGWKGVASIIAIGIVASVLFYSQVDPETLMTSNRQAVSTEDSVKPEALSEHNSEFSKEMDTANDESGETSITEVLPGTSEANAGDGQKVNTKDSHVASAAGVESTVAAEKSAGNGKAPTNKMSGAEADKVTSVAAVKSKETSGDVAINIPSTGSIDRSTSKREENLETTMRSPEKVADNSMEPTELKETSIQQKTDAKESMTSNDVATNAHNVADNTLSSKPVRNVEDAASVTASETGNGLGNSTVAPGTIGYAYDISNERQIRTDISMGENSLVNGDSLASISKSKITEEEYAAGQHALGVTTTDDDVDTWSFGRGFSIKVGFSPDFSSVSFKPSSGMGFNLALLGEYRFANRWSISSGLITSRKVYTGSDVEYEASNAQVYIADDMDGSCSVMDIPINVSYSFGNPGRTSFFVTAGLSSYMMMKENYTWSYDNGSSFNVEASNKNNDWFKQLNLSIGVQKKLSNHFFVQLEPFVKAPLAGVGEGKVSLTSLGAFLNLKYSFSK